MDKSNSPESFVTAVLEHDQLSTKKQSVRRKHLHAGQLAMLWLLRLYLFFMLGVVLYQVWLQVR